MVTNALVTIRDHKGRFPHMFYKEVLAMVTIIMVTIRLRQK